MRKILNTAALCLSFLAASVSPAVTAGFGNRLEPKEPSGGDLIRYQMHDLASRAYEDLNAVEVVESPGEKKTDGRTTPGGSAETGAGSQSAEKSTTP